MRHVVGLLLILAVALPSLGVLAQGMMPQPRPMASPSTSEKKTGPAEAAPETDQDEPEPPPLPAWPGTEERKVQFFELHGYFRVRGDIFHNLNLSQPNIRLGTSGATYAPFWGSIAELSDIYSCDARRTRSVVGTGNGRSLSGSDCPGRTLSGANMRLRLEPTINVTDRVRVHAQIDVFDNMMLGSTPDNMTATGTTLSAPDGFFSDSQAAPIAGVNSQRPAILVKRAWGEVGTAIGQLTFGRMPWHWGMGMLANDGECWDCNYGTNLDRIRFETPEIAHHRFGLGYDFASSGPNTLSVLAGRPGYNAPYYGTNAVDLEQLDDVDQLVMTITRSDEKQAILEQIANGKLVLNYGAAVLWRKQDFGYSSTANGSSVGTLNRTQSELAAQMVERHAWSWTSDLWLKLRWRRLSIDVEGLLTGGRIENISDDPNDVQGRDILQYGLVVRSRYTFFHDMLKVHFELGTASGDDSEMYDLNRMRQPLYTSGLRDGALNEMRFNPDFLVDLILFREILGTVANATYFKPSVQFDWLETLGARLDLIYSLANRPVAYPGNARNLGLEMDLDLYYHSQEDGFSLGVQYGLLVPFGALDRPASIYLSDAKGAGLAQVVQGRAMIRF